LYYKKLALAKSVHEGRLNRKNRPISKGEHLLASLKLVREWIFAQKNYPNSNKVSQNDTVNGDLRIFCSVILNQ
jgi:hypothetical protein